MGLLTGSRSSSSTEVNNISTSETINQDNRIAVTDAGIGFKLDGDNNSLVITQTDRGAVQQGIDLSRAALELGQTSLDSNNRVSLGAIDSLAAAHTAQLGIVSGTATAQLRAQQDFARQAIDAAAAAERAAGERLAQGYAGFSRDLVTGYEGFTRQANENASRSYNFLTNSLDSVLDFSRDETARASSIQADALAAIRTTNDRIVSHITESQKTPDERAFSSAIPWIVIGGTVAVIFIFGRKRA